MSPNSRKSRLAEEITNMLGSDKLSPSDQVDVLTLSLKQLGIYDLFKFMWKPTKCGQKLTPNETRLAVWNFWHSAEFLQESTLSSRPPKIRCSKRSNIQKDLEFNVHTTTVIQRSQKFYEAQWLIFQNTLKELYCIFIQCNPDHYVSWVHLMP